MERYKLSLEECRHITTTQFDKEFEIYHHLSKAFFSMIVKLSFFTEYKLELKDSSKENLVMKIDEFMGVIKVVSVAQDILYENAAFIPKNIFEQFDRIYEKANDLFWRYQERLEAYVGEKLDYEELVDEKDKALVKELKEDFLVL